MKCLKIDPCKQPVEVDIDPGLESLQNAVGGYIEAVYPYDDPVALICNEEGKICGMPLNRALRNDLGEIYDIIAGAFLVVGLGDESFEDLTPELCARYSALFHVPEEFVKIGNRVFAVPVN